MSAEKEDKRRAEQATLAILTEDKLEYSPSSTFGLNCRFPTSEFVQVG